MELLNLPEDQSCYLLDVGYVFLVFGGEMCNYFFITHEHVHRFDYIAQAFVCMSVFLLSCGSGLSGDHLSEEGHYWVGVDISTAMLSECLGSHSHLYSVS